MECHPVFLMELTDEIPNLRSQDFLHRRGLRRDYIHFDIAAPERYGHFETDEARADHNRPSRG
jgi:hypothetical protein